MQTQSTWRMGRSFDCGLFLADSLLEAAAQVAPVCRLTGYRQRDVLVWRDGSYPKYWVSKPRGQGGYGADTMAEAVRMREELSKVLGVLVIRENGSYRAMTRGEAARQTG